MVDNGLCSPRGTFKCCERHRTFCTAWAIGDTTLQDIQHLCLLPTRCTRTTQRSQTFTERPPPTAPCGSHVPVAIHGSRRDILSFNLAPAGSSGAHSDPFCVHLCCPDPTPPRRGHKQTPGGESSVVGTCADKPTRVNCHRAEPGVRLGRPSALWQGKEEEAASGSCRDNTHFSSMQ